MDVLTKALGTADRYLSVLHTNPYVSAMIMVFLLMYASMAAPSLPPSVASLFENTLFRVFILFLILVTRNYNSGISLLVAVAFLLSMQTLNTYHVNNMASDLFGSVKRVATAVSDTVSNLSGSEKFDDSNSAGPEAQPLVARPPHPGPQDNAWPSYKEKAPAGVLGYPGRNLASFGQPESEL